ncbi:MAG: GNAT family N-acetyltransferase [Candidatus Marinimicrobia bacterium]|nr:GNAT family N-acetyltransferase [Candidatus Neomarinimicrobiota bacterium]
MFLPIVRKATQNDIQQIVEFNKSMALETEGLALNPFVLESGVQEIFKNPQNGFYIVCEVDNVVCACLMITYEWSDWRNGLFWWIQSVFVQKEFRQKGLYKLMYEFVKAKVELSENTAGIRLYVDEKNGRAKTVYEKLGMTKSNYEMFEYEKSKTPQ